MTDLKPSNWEQMSLKDKKEVASRLFASLRGNFIISQALVIASGEMRKVPAPHTETSNIQDMEMLVECIFPAYQMCVDVGAVKPKTVAPEKSKEPTQFGKDMSKWVGAVEKAKKTTKAKTETPEERRKRHIEEIGRENDKMNRLVEKTLTKPKAKRKAK